MCGPDEMYRGGSVSASRCAARGMHSPRGRSCHLGRALNHLAGTRVLEVSYRVKNRNVCAQLVLHMTACIMRLGKLEGGLAKQEPVGPYAVVFVTRAYMLY